ncbi:reverse gyrase [Sulfolobales archaeon HS-7]|nr:reverse gyrase [Sulfolobales archaeon HS-7]
MISITYQSGCPNCGGPITGYRSYNGLPCEKCLPLSPNALPEQSRTKAIYDLLVEFGNLKGFWRINDIEESVDTINKFFVQITGHKPWGLQTYWLKRYIQEESFSMSAPTGLGKSTTIMVITAHLALQGKSVYYITPTKSLAEQTCDKLKSMKLDYACNAIDNSSVIVSTYQMLNRNFDKLENRKFDLVAVDDADAIIRSGKTAERVVKLLGIPNELFENAVKLVKLKRLLSFYKVMKPDDVDALQQKIDELVVTIAKNKVDISQLIIASATARPKGIKQEALKYLLGFEASTIQFYMRNIVDAFTKIDLESVISKIGRGGLILVSKDKGKTLLKQLRERVESLGYKADLAVSGKKFMDKFSRGETDMLIGTASYYGVAVRGLDEPYRLRYVVFYGVPKNRIKLIDAVKNPLNSIKIGRVLGFKTDQWENQVLSLSPQEMQIIKIANIRGEKLSGKLGEIQERSNNLAEQILDYVKDLNRRIVGDSFIIYKENGVFLAYPDMMTYIQGSGRSSRLFNGGLTKGLAITIIDDDELYKILRKRLEYLIDAFTPVQFEEVNLPPLLEEMEKTRIDGGKKFDIKTSLLIVESPTKAKTIAKMFGYPVKRMFSPTVMGYETIITDESTMTSRLVTVIATRGHLFDLTLDNIGEFGIEIEGEEIKPHYSPLNRCKSCGRILSTNQEKCPYCNVELIPHSTPIIDAIRKVSLEVDEVLIATDPDVEGEKIAYDVASMVIPYNKNVKRVKYHAVTKDEILTAIRNAGSISIPLVESEVIRRIEDRWIGFYLSSMLKAHFSSQNHGAGRVQTPVLGWITDYTKEYKSHLGWIAVLKVDDLRVEKFFRSKKEAEKYINEISEISISKINEKVEVFSAPSPFTTDQLLMEASVRYRFSPELVMSVLQNLFEIGVITYHRTDSTYVSPTGIGIAKTYLYQKGLGNFYSGRSWGHSGTHEAIRPTKSMDVEELKNEIRSNPYRYSIKFSEIHFKIYDLIFRRFLASQMTDALLSITKYEIDVGNERFVQELPTKMSGGFSALYQLKLYNVSEGKFRPEKVLRRGSTFKLPNYADVIHMMKNKNIGRPSTYSKTLQQLKRHGYVIESKKNKMLVATRRGMNVYTYLTEKFPDMISETRTAYLLKQMDLVAQGQLSPDVVVGELRSDIRRSISSISS